MRWCLSTQGCPNCIPSVAGSISVIRVSPYVYIYRETEIIYAILWCSESCDCNKDESDKQNALWLWHPKDHCCENMAPSLPQSLRRGHRWSRRLMRTCTEVSAALESSCRTAQMSQQLQNMTILIVNLVAFWMHLHTCRRFQGHLRMLLKSLRVHCKAPGGPGSIWKYLETLVRATGVSGRFGCGFQTDLHFADEVWWHKDVKYHWTTIYRQTVTCHIQLY